MVMKEQIGLYVRREKIGDKDVTIIRPYKPSERIREEIERDLLNEGYVYIGYTSISADPCSYRFETEVLEAQDIIVIDLTYQRGPEIYVDKYYYVKPPARVLFRDYLILSIL